MVVSGFYKIYGMLVTKAERRELAECGWVMADKPHPGEDFIRGPKDSRCVLIQIPHGYEDLKMYEDKWFFGIGKCEYIGPASEEKLEEEIVSEYEKYTDQELFNLINSQICFVKAKKAKIWIVPDDCPCCS